MGFNTVMFMLNDYSHEIQKSPKSVLWMIAHPPMSSDHRELESIRLQVAHVARDNGENPPHPQMVEVLPTFHADFTHYYRAGQNSIDVLEFVKTTRVKGKKCVVLQLPDYMQK